MTTSYLRSATLLVLCGMVASCTGLISLKLYIDPSLPVVKYDDLKPVENPGSIGVLVEFSNSDGLNRAVTADARTIVLRVLEQSGFFSTIYSGTALSDTTLEITIENIDGTTEGNAYATGFSFGLIGTATTDPYRFTASYQAADKAPVIKEYYHAVHSTIGLKGGPEGLKAVPTEQAFEQVVQQLMLNLLRDLQNERLI